MADRDIETVVDGMETWRMFGAALGRKIDAAIRFIEQTPLPCGCDPESDHKCPEHRTEPA